MLPNMQDAVAQKLESVFKANKDSAKMILNVNNHFVDSFIQKISTLENLLND